MSFLCFRFDGLADTVGFGRDAFFLSASFSARTTSTDLRRVAASVS